MTKTTNPIEEPVANVNEEALEQMVTVNVPYAVPGEDNRIYLSINMRTWLIPRGRAVQLPRYAAEKLMHVLRENQRLEREIADTYNEPLSEALL